MKRFLPLAALLLLAAGCNLKTANFTDDQAIPLGEGRADSLILSVSLDYPVKGTGEEALAAITSGILNAAFDLEDIDPTSVDETATRYEDNLKDEYFNENEDLPAGEGGILSWEDRINGYFSGRYKGYESYMVEYYNFRGGAHGINTMTPIVFQRKTGRIVPEDEFFADGYRDPVGALIRNHIPEALENDEDVLSDLDDPESIGPNGSYEVTREGVTWYYQPYEIAPYYVGVIIVTVPWNELKPYLRK